MRGSWKPTEQAVPWRREWPAVSNALGKSTKVSGSTGHQIQQYGLNKSFSDEGRV